MIDEILLQFTIPGHFTASTLYFEKNTQNIESTKLKERYELGEKEREVIIEINKRE